MNNQTLIKSASSLGTESLINSTRKILKDKDSGSFHFDGMVQSKYHGLDIRCSPANIERALKFMEKCIDYFLAQGYDTLVKNHETVVVVKGREVQIACHEKSKVLPKDPSDRWGSRKLEPTGILCFKADSIYKYEWKEGKMTLEEQLPLALKKIVQRIDELHETWEKNRIRREKEDIELKLIQDLENKKDKELVDFKNLLDTSLRWQNTKVLRAYLNEIKDSNKNKNRSSEEHKSWIEWAEKKIDWYDPTVEAKDPLLSSVDRNTLTLMEEEEDEFESDGIQEV